MSPDDIRGLMKKAGDSLGAAEALLREGYSDFSVSRAYYAMFYAAQAALLTKGLSFSKHSAVLSAFGKEFVKNGTVPRILHRHLLDAFDARQAGDYGSTGSVSEEDARIVLANAKQFVENVDGLVKDEKK